MPPEPSPVPAQPTSLISWPPSRLLIVVLITGAISSLVSLYLMYGPVAGAPKVSLDGVMVTFGPYAEGRLFELGEGGQFMPAAAPGGSVFGQAMSASTTYQLVSEGDLLVTNVYAVSPDGARTQLTDTDTFKADLSYDAQAGILLYRSYPVTTYEDVQVKRDRDIVALDLATGETRTIGQGSVASLIPGGSQALALVSGELTFLPLSGTSTPVSVKTLSAITPLAIDAETGMVLAYNATTGMVDRYQASAPSQTLIYLDSIATDRLPTGLGFINGQPVAAYASEKPGRHVIQALPGGQDQVLRAPEGLSGITRIISL